MAAEVTRRRYLCADAAAPGGGGKYSNFRVTPTIGPVSVGNLNFRKSKEQSTPGYYAVSLQQDGWSVEAELTATRLAGVTRFTFPRGAESNIILEITSHVFLAQRATHAEATILENLRTAWILLF
jgi:putative alpha-1,2-mannosidase